MSTDEPIPPAAPAVQFPKNGGIDVLTVADRPVPHPAGDEVLIRVRAAGINPGEAAIREGRFRSSFPVTYPSGEGTDFAGVVTSLGASVEDFAVGDEVIGWSEQRSSQATYVAVPSWQLIRKPAEIEWPVAGALFVVSVTAFAAVRAVAAGPGDTVVVSAAGGGVGSIAVQLARLRGATVLGIASEPDHEWLRSVGVTPVVWGDGLSDRIRALAPDGVDALIDTHSAEYIDLGIELGVRPERIDTVISYAAAQAVGAKTDGSMTASDAGILAEMAGYVARGEIEIRIGKTFPMAEVRAAFELLEHGHPRGKVVLIPA